MKKNTLKRKAPSPAARLAGKILDIEAWLARNIADKKAGLTGFPAEYQENLEQELSQLKTKLAELAEGDE